jgi:hypothetical protein
MDSNELNELNMDIETYKKVKGKLNPDEKKSVTITTDKTSDSMATQMEESIIENEVIEPKDQETIKYLSNVIDKNTGEISKPFTISDKKYQMVRGQKPSGEVVMGVYCFDDMGENGENVIHPIEYFEENIAKPMKEITSKNVKNDNSKKSLGLGEFKHYIVNEKTGKFRKFKSIEELARTNMGEEEKYMTIREFKKFFEGRVFGSKKSIVSEVNPTGEESDEEMNIKAKKLMDMIKKRIPSNIIDTIKTPVARREVIAAFAEMIGVPRTGLAELISGLKDLSKVDAQQSTNIQETKKIIKVKDIGHE